LLAVTAMEISVCDSKVSIFPLTSYRTWKQWFAVGYNVPKTTFVAS
jgi:hypothetical protein